MMNPPEYEVPKLWRVYWNDPWAGDDLLVEGFNYDTGTYFFFTTDKKIVAVNMVDVGRLTIEPVPAGEETTDFGAAWESAKNEQAQDPRWLGAV